MRPYHNLSPLHFDQGTILLQHLFPEINPSLIPIVFHRDRHSFQGVYDELSAIVEQSKTKPRTRDWKFETASSDPKQPISLLLRQFKGKILQPPPYKATLPPDLVVNESSLIAITSTILHGPLMQLEGGPFLTKTTPPMQIECECCCDDMASPGNLEVACLAGHRFCTTCLQQHVTECAFGRNEFRIPCMRMGDKCSAEFPDHAIRLALVAQPRVQKQFFRLRNEKKKASFGLDAKALQREFHHILAERMTKTVVHYCPGCQKALLKVGGACKSIVCPHCEMKSCYACRKPIHWLQYHSCSCPSPAEGDERRLRDQLLEDTKTEAAVRSGDAAATIAAELAKLGFPEMMELDTPSYEVKDRRLFTVLVMIALIGLASLSVVLGLFESQHLEPPPLAPSPPVGALDAWMNAWIGLFESQHLEPPVPSPPVVDTWINMSWIEVLLGAIFAIK